METSTISKLSQRLYQVYIAKNRPDPLWNGLNHSYTDQVMQRHSIRCCAIPRIYSMHRFTYTKHYVCGWLQSSAYRLNHAENPSPRGNAFILLTCIYTRHKVVVSARNVCQN